MLCLGGGSWRKVEEESKIVIILSESRNTMDIIT